jgi:hypothetical protein
MEYLQLIQVLKLKYPVQKRKPSELGKIFKDTVPSIVVNEGSSGGQSALSSNEISTGNANAKEFIKNAGLHVVNEVKDMKLSTISDVQESEEEVKSSVSKPEDDKVDMQVHISCASSAAKLSKQSSDASLENLIYRKPVEVRSRSIFPTNNQTIEAPLDRLNRHIIQPFLSAKIDSSNPLFQSDSFATSRRSSQLTTSNESLPRSATSRRPSDAPLSKYNTASWRASSSYSSRPTFRTGIFSKPSYYAVTISVV